MDKETQVIIFGNESHPEVISLKGQSKGSVLVSKNFEEIKSKVNPDLPLRVFSQTTQNTEAYKDFITEIKGFLNDNNSEHNLEYTNSICKAVSNRNISLSKFATENDIIIFVGGKNSSNGKMLFEHCRNINVNSYYISNSSELDKNWFVNKNSAGVCGATSTPQWLMEEIAKEIITI